MTEEVDPTPSSEASDPVFSEEPKPVDQPKNKSIVVWILRGLFGFLTSQQFSRRVRLYSLTAFLGVSFVALGISDFMLQVRYFPMLAAKPLLDMLPFPYHVDSVRWIAYGELEMKGLVFGTEHPELPGENLKIFFQSRTVELKFTLTGLLNQRLAELDFTEPQLLLGRFESKVVSSGSNPTDRIQQLLMGQLNWVVGQVKISRGTIIVGNLGPNKNLFIPIRIGARYPEIVHNVQLNDLDKGEAGQQLQIVQITGVKLISPQDPLSPVADLPLTQIMFTYGGLWHRHLKEVRFVRSTLFLGADLFSFADQFKTQPDKSVPASSPVPTSSLVLTGADQPTFPWTIDRVSLKYGELGVSAFGQPPVTFPFILEEDINDIRTDDMTKLTLKTAIEIRRFDEEYKSYKVKIVNLHGLLKFNMSSGSSEMENAVQTLKVDELSWNGIAVTDSIATLVFDQTGISGHIEGKCYTGKLQGDFKVTYDQGFPWNLHVKAEQVDLDPIADRLVSKYCSLSGKATGYLNVQGSTIDILKSDGVVSMEEPGGILKLTSLEELVKRYPVVGNQMKQVFIEFLVSSLKEYPYNVGKITVDYTPKQGQATLFLNGPRGKRDVHIYYHPYPDPALAKTSVNSEGKESNKAGP